MFRSLMTVIRELYLYLTNVIFMLKYSVKLRRYMYLVMWQHVAQRHVCCVQSRTTHNTHAALQSHSAQHTTHMPPYSLTLHSTQHTCRPTVSLCTTHNTHAALRHAATSPNLYNEVTLVRYR